MSHRWLRLIEDHWCSSESRYLLVEDEQGPCIALVATLTECFGNTGWMKWLYQHLNLVFVTPHTLRCGVVARPDSLALLVPKALPAMEQLCRKEKRLLMTIGNVPVYEVPAWQQAGFLATPQFGVNVLDLPASYELYLDALRPKDRSELRRIRKHAGELDVSFKIEGLAEEGEQIYALFKNVYARHGTSDDAMPFSLPFFAELGHHLPEEAFFVKGYLDGQLCGVFLCLRSGPTLWWVMAGLDYEKARPAYLYFLLMDEMIRWSLEQGIQRIYGGAGTEREKQRHGFHLEERWFCYRTSVPVLNQFLSWALPVAQRLTSQARRSN